MESEHIESRDRVNDDQRQSYKDENPKLVSPSLEIFVITLKEDIS